MDKTGLIIKAGAVSRTELLNKLADLTQNLLGEDLRKVNYCNEVSIRSMESEEIVAIANVYETIADSIAKLPSGDGSVTVTNCIFNGLTTGLKVEQKQPEQIDNDEEILEYHDENEIKDENNEPNPNTEEDTSTKNK